MKTFITLFFGFLVVVGYSQEKKYVTVKKSVPLMGESFGITVVAVNEELGYINIEEAAAEINRINKLISSWDSNSETHKINENAGIKPVKVKMELFALIERAIQISEITDGAFDITFASKKNVWQFNGKMKYPPTKEEISTSISSVGYRNIILNKEEQTVFLKKKGMRISFGAIGKGYAVDKAKALLMSNQVISGVINASGDITTWGTKVSGEKWLLGVADPVSNYKILTWLPILESSVSTTDVYEKYVSFKGEKYGHILDPRTGSPVRGLKKATVFAKSAELCDALVTAVLVLGLDKGVSLINQLGGTEAIFVDDNNRIHKTNGLILDNAILK
ncbi:FAD:protein FMN transferase [uncultured Maribacter sp.]|uniref:FAD:protein FMN transferase n=1 Tax=uncultured Maribacter sp. TaxID=431308 RepID=UPI0026168C1D|nr:FAD:protein FMN transferase [uncultured Maribacter sp.]